VSESPSIVILAGPNGAGKSTVAARMVGRSITVANYVNADVLAQELASDDPEGVAFEAGRRALLQIEGLIAQGASFGFETTLAGRTYVTWLRRAIAAGYELRLIYL
jgi:predicted ABC-type ATPase